jgi:hypothetical protein
MKRIKTIPDWKKRENEKPEIAEENERTTVGGGLIIFRHVNQN